MIVRRSTLFFGALAATLSTLSLAAGCSSVLGLETLTPLPDEAGAESGSGDRDGSSNDASTDGEVTDADADTSCTPDAASDSKHCGRCGHDCGGGSCTEGVCQPLVLADGLAYPKGLVVDATNVYVADWELNRILKFDRNGGGPCITNPNACVFESVQSNVFKPTALGIDANRVYWTNTGGNYDHEIRSCPKTGCGGQAAMMVANLGPYAFDHLFGNDVMPLELIVRDGRVFWPESTGSAIRSVFVDGGGLQTHLENDDYMPLALAVDDQRIYFTDDTNQHQTQIASVPRTPGAATDGGGIGVVQVIAETPARPYGIALAATNSLFWSIPYVESVDDGLIQSAPKTADGGPPVGAIASGQLDPRGVIVDAKNVYWIIAGFTDSATGMVVTCPLTGCPAAGPTVLARQQRFPLHITQDDGFIYWTNDGISGAPGFDGQLVKVAKP